jgi:hypothetical protein
MLMVNKTDEDNDHSDDLLTDTIMTRRMKEEEVVVEKKDGGGGRQSGVGGEASRNAVPVTPASLWHLLLLTLNSRGKVIGSGTLAARWHEGEESQEAREMVMQPMVMSEVMR